MRGGGRLQRSKHALGARSVLVLLLVMLLMGFLFSLAVSYFIPVETRQRPEIYYALVIAQESLMFGLPAYLFILWVRPRYGPVLLGRLHFPPLNIALRTAAAAILGLWMYECYTALWMVLLDGTGAALSVPAIPLPESGPQTVLALLAVALVPAILEEVVFRGMVHQGLARDLKEKTAVWLSALLFAFMHRSLAALPVHITLGIVLTLLAARSGSLQLSMLYHFVHNATSLIFSLYARNVVSQMSSEALSAMNGVDGQGAFSSVLSILPMTVITTVAYIFLIRPLLKKGETNAIENQVIITQESDHPKRQWMVAALAALLFLLLLPDYVIGFLPI